MKKVDDQRVGALLLQRSGSRPNLFLVQWDDWYPVRVHSFGNLDPQFSRYQRLERSGHAVWSRARSPSELQNVAKTARGNEPDQRTLAFQQRIGGGGRAVD